MAPEPASLAVVQALGAQATQWFAGALGVLLLVVAALGWMLRRHASRRDRHPPVAGLAGLLVLGFAIVVVAGMVFAFVARLVDAGESLGRLDQAFSDAVRQGASVPGLAAFVCISCVRSTPS